jgi:hypothetical protein
MTAKFLMTNLQTTTSREVAKNGQIQAVLQLKGKMASSKASKKFQDNALKKLSQKLGTNDHLNDSAWLPFYFVAQVTL